MRCHRPLPGFAPGIAGLGSDHRCQPVPSVHWGRKTLPGALLVLRGAGRRRTRLRAGAAFQGLSPGGGMDFSRRRRGAIVLGIRSSRRTHPAAETGPQHRPGRLPGYGVTTVRLRRRRSPHRRAGHAGWRSRQRRDGAGPRPRVGTRAGTSAAGDGPRAAWRGRPGAVIEAVLGRGLRPIAGGVAAALGGGGDSSIWA